MKKKSAVIPIAVGFAILILLSLIPVIILNNRAPVLIVTEEAFVMLYGEERIRRESFQSSLILFRPVKTVSVVNDAGNDIIASSVSDMSQNPYCVLFPLRFARAAKMYREQNPHVPVVMLEGRFPESAAPSASAIGDDVSDYHVFRTNIEADFFKAGIAAAALDKGKNGHIYIYMESNLPQAQYAFNQGVREWAREYLQRIEASEKNRGQAEKPESEPQESELLITDGKGRREDRRERMEKALVIVDNTGGRREDRELQIIAKTLEKAEEIRRSEERKEDRRIRREGVIIQEIPAIPEITGALPPPPIPNIRFFTAPSRITDASDISCVVLVDISGDFLENIPDVPIILFSWFNLGIIPEDVVLVINDSPWAQVVQAVNMVSDGKE